MQVCAFMQNTKFHPAIIRSIKKSDCPHRRGLDSDRISGVLIRKWAQHCSGMRQAPNPNERKLLLYGIRGTVFFDFAPTNEASGGGAD